MKSTGILNEDTVSQCTNGDTVLWNLRWDECGRIYIPSRALKAALWHALGGSYPKLSPLGGRRCGGMVLAASPY